MCILEDSLLMNKMVPCSVVKVSDEVILEGSHIGAPLGKGCKAPAYYRLNPGKL